MVTVGDLRKAIADCDDSVLLVISDGHEGLSQMNVNSGFFPVFQSNTGKEYTDTGYVSTLKNCKRNYPEAKKYVPAIQIDTGV